MSVTDCADYVLCDGDSEESSVGEVAAWGSRQALDVHWTGQDSIAHDSARLLKSSLFLLLFLFFSSLNLPLIAQWQGTRF